MRPLIWVLAVIGLFAGIHATASAAKVPPTGARCRPYVCFGRVYPTCTQQGTPINYWRNPCVPLPRR